MIHYTFKREPDESVAYLRVHLDDKDQLSEDWQGRAVTVYRDEYLAMCLRDLPKGVAWQSLEPGRLITDLETFRATIKTRRESLKLSKIAMAKIIGISNVAYSKIESGESAGMPETLQKICYVLRIWYNFLPHEGRPQHFYFNVREDDRHWLEDVKKKAVVRKNLWETVLSRILTLGFRLSQTQELLGVSYSDLRRMILAEKELPESFRKLLQDRLHLRILPAPQKFTDQNEFVNWVGQISGEWHMTLREWEKITGMSFGNCKDFLDGKHGPDSETSKMMASALGASLDVDVVATLENPGSRFVHDASLILTMESQRRRAGLSLHGLAVRAGVDPDVFNAVFTRLFEAASTHSTDTLVLDFSGISTTRHQSREMLKEVCRILKIDLMERDFLEREPVSVTKGEIESWGAVVSAFVRRRKMLLVSQKEFVRIYRESTGDSLSINSLVALERGEIKGSLIPVARKIAGFLGVDVVEVDPQPLLSSVNVHANPATSSVPRRRTVYEVGQENNHIALHSLDPQFYNLWLLIHMQNRAKVLQTQPAQILARKGFSEEFVGVVRELFECFRGINYPDKPSPLAYLLGRISPIPQNPDAEDLWFKSMREIFSALASDLEISFHQSGRLPFYRVDFDSSRAGDHENDLVLFAKKICEAIVWRRLCLFLSRMELAVLSEIDVDDLIMIESKNISYRELMQMERKIFSVSHVLGLSLGRIPESVHRHFSTQGHPPVSSYNPPRMAPSGATSGLGRGSQNKASGAARVVPQIQSMRMGGVQTPGLFRPFGTMGRFR